MHKIFGTKENVSYTTRVGAYIIPIENNKIGVIKTSKGYFLIGGEKDDSETDEECINRECLEEIGHSITINTKICSAETFTYHDKLGYFHPVQIYYTGIINEKVKEPIETDHEFFWLDCNDINNKMYVEMQNWAIKQCIKGLE